VQQFNVMNEELSCVTVAGKILAVGATSGKIVFYNLETAKRVVIFEDSHMEEVTALKFHPTYASSNSLRAALFNLYLGIRRN